MPICRDTESAELIIVRWSYIALSLTLMLGYPDNLLQQIGMRLGPLQRSALLLRGRSSNPGLHTNCFKSLFCSGNAALYPDFPEQQAPIGMFLTPKKIVSPSVPAAHSSAMARSKREVERDCSAYNICSEALMSCSKREDCKTHQSLGVSGCGHSSQ